MANPQPPYWGRQGNGSGEPERIYGVWGDSENGSGVVGTNIAYRNQAGVAGVVGISHNPGIGVLGLSAPGGIGVRGEVEQGVGVSARSSDGTGMIAQSLNGVGLYATGSGDGVQGHSSSGTGNGVQGDSSAGVGVRGTSFKGFGIEGVSTQAPGVRGRSYGDGVRGDGDNSGVRGASNAGVGVRGESGSGTGVRGESNNVGVLGMGPNSGVVAFNSKNANAAYLASNCCAAYFTGEVAVIGFLSKSGGGFLIDHPAHPSEKFLAHSFVESSEMKNVYDGIAILNSKGEATVRLPAWFEHLNSDFRYQLTPIGGPAPGLHIAQEIEGNRFKIAGGAREMKISWQVTGVRKDAWASANPFKVEQKKSSAERGHFLHPELHGASGEQSIAALRHPVR